MSEPKVHTPVAIIGAGPAGVAAAVRLNKAGINCHLIDEHQNVGGAIYRNSKRAKPALKHLDDDVKDGIAEILELYNSNKKNIEFLNNTQVLGAEAKNHKLLLLREGRCITLSYDFLIVCTGCHEKTIPFPGWTLAGVMTIGGLQLQLKSGLVKPGNHAVIAGTGPLLSLVAKQAHQAGMSVESVLEAGRRLDLAKHTKDLLKNKPLMTKGIRYQAYMKRHNIPMHWGWGVVEAHGEKQLEAVTIAPYDKSWNPDRSKSKTVETDVLGVSYGFLPRSQLTQILGVRHEYDKFSGLRPVRDKLGRVSRHRTYVAGDTGGINGSKVAAHQGTLAAIAILIDSELLSSDELMAEAVEIQEKAAPLMAFSQAFESFSATRPGLLQLPKNDTIVCRCEQVTQQQVYDAIDKGAKDITGLKMKTRVCMGDCQGKICAAYCCDVLKQKTGQQDVGRLRPRFPLAPLPIGATANTEVEA